ncbi:MAG: sigma-54-dependent Fis family transcriptional regulator [Myxococcales bacterium]|nr:sigma-54-dependent Fis family transcriptional regulator [Myxococcales bacterium]
MRLPCWLGTRSGELRGHTVLLGIEGMQVRLPSGSQLQPEERVEFRVWLRDAPLSLSGEAVVRSLGGDERDRPTGEVDLSFGGSPSFVEALRCFLAELRHTVLAVDPDKGHLDFVLRALGQDYRVLSCRLGSEALGLLRGDDVAVVIASESIEDMSCAELLRRCDEVAPALRVARVIASRSDRADLLQQMVTSGEAFQSLSLPCRESELRQVVRRAVDARSLALDNDRLTLELERVHRRLLRENLYLRRRLEVSAGFAHIIGRSPALLSAFAELEAVGRTDTTVHICGETGTGKELVARALHFGGPRADGPFVAHNCAGMSETLLQSTLFGHRRGAFTGGDRDYPGVFEQADRGTLFLDEVAELPGSVQVALLRALQDREVVPLGASAPVKVDVRIVSATHKDLREEVRAGSFREDLYFRLVVISVKLPALRERAGDVPILARHFLNLHCQHHGKEVPDFIDEAMRALQRYGWPGNVRELENEVEREVVLAQDGRMIDLGLLSPHIREAEPAPPAQKGSYLLIPRGRTYDQAVEELSRALVKRALSMSGGVVSAAAQLLSMERSRLAKLKSRLEERG